MRVMEILRAADRNGDMSHISRALKLTKKCVATPDIEHIVHNAVSKFGWSLCEDMVTDFLCYRDVATMRSCESVVLTLSKLVQEYNIPRKLTLEVLQVIVGFVEKKEGFRAASKQEFSLLDMFRTDKKKETAIVCQWCTLLDIIEKIRTDSSAADEVQDVDKLVDRLVQVIGRLKEDQLEKLEKGLKLGPRQGPYSFPDTQFRSAASKRRKKLQLAKFLEEADYIIENKSMRTKDFSCSDGWGLREQRGVFVNAACRVFSADVVDKTAQERFDSVLKIIPSLSKENMAVLLSDANREQLAGMHGPTILLIKQTIESAKILNEEKALRERIQKLEAATVVKPENVQVRYPGPFGSGNQEIERFMASEQMLKIVWGFRSVVTARKTLRSFRDSLPDGMEAEASGHGMNSFIRLQKPFSRERELWLKYKNDVAELGEVRKQLSALLKKLSPRPVTSQNASKRLKTENQGTSSGVGIRSKSRHQSVAKKEEDVL